MLGFNVYVYLNLEQIRIISKYDQVLAIFGKPFYFLIFCSISIVFINLLPSRLLNYFTVYYAGNFTNTFYKIIHNVAERDIIFSNEHMYIYRNHTIDAKINYATKIATKLSSEFSEPLLSISELTQICNVQIFTEINTVLRKKYLDMAAKTAIETGRLEDLAVKTTTPQT
jgi:hypothetical protein